MSQANKSVTHFPSWIIGKPVELSKCQQRINTFQLHSMQAAAGGLAHISRVISRIPIGVWRQAAGQISGCLYQIIKKINSTFQVQIGRFRLWRQDVKAEERVQLPSFSAAVSYLVVVKTAGCLSSLLHQHTCHYCYNGWWVICSSVQQALSDPAWPVY